MKKIIIIICFIILSSNLSNAKTTFLPDWMGGDMSFDTFDGDPNQDNKFCSQAGIYHEASGCAEPKIFDEYCPYDDSWISDCYCPSVFSKTCTSPYRGDDRKVDERTGYASCDDKWVACCDTRCPNDTSLQDPGGCGGSTVNDCGETCYYPYKECCVEGGDENCTGETSCPYGYTSSCTDCSGNQLFNCNECAEGGSKSCGGQSNPCGDNQREISHCTNCSGTTLYTCEECTNGGSNSCSGQSTPCGKKQREVSRCTNCDGTTLYTCEAIPENCVPEENEDSCKYGYRTCDDGCGGTRTCCCQEGDRDCACAGYYYCEPTTKYGDGKTCSDGIRTYHEQCLAIETCNNDGIGSYTGSEGYCVTNHSSLTYYIKDKCTTQKGEVIKYYGICGGYSWKKYKDCFNNVAPCAGMEACDDGNGVGEPCECGEKKYYTKCKCDTNDVKEKGGTCWAKDSELHNGVYYIRDKCSLPNNKTVILYYSCNTKTKDCTGKLPPCAGKKECPGDAGTGLCECGGIKYFDKCTETCNDDWEYINRKWYYAYEETDSKFKTEGRYKVSLKCTQANGTKIYYGEKCNVDDIDFKGNYAPCKGKKACDSGYIGLGEVCSCGGLNYYENCATICNYEDTEDSCSAQGKKFKQKCYGVIEGSDVQKWYGECK